MSVTLNTTLGPLKIEVFCESVPKTAEVSQAKATYSRPSTETDRCNLLTCRTSSRYAHPTITTALLSTA